MKTLYLTSSSNIAIDQDTSFVNQLESDREPINRIYAIDEQMHVVYGNGEYHKEFDVEPGDIVITFYTERYSHQVAVAKSKDWYENIIEYRKELQAEKERWAKEKAQKELRESTILKQDN